MSRISPARSADVDASFERFVVSASPGLLRTAYLLTGDRGHAEDLLQSALMRTLRRWQAISQSPHAYTREVLINLARDGYRARGRRPRETRGDVPPELAAPDQTDGMLERDAITRAAAQLPAAQRGARVPLPARPVRR
jgi:DNA-directed RNA polymerase specialized sigma24 family protein